MDHRRASHTCLVLCLFFRSLGSSTPRTENDQSVSTEYICPNLIVELVVSPVVSPSEIRLLQLTWSTQEDIKPGDYVALYQEDPATDPGQPLFNASVIAQEGWVTSNVKQNRTNSAALGFTPQCLGYWIAYKNQAHSVVASSCLKTEPRWMQEHRSDIQDLKLSEVFFPGTHNSGSFIETDEPFYESVLQKYVYTQDESTLNQLIYGARYLDLRVGYYPETKAVWWVNHSYFRVRPLKQILDDIIEFVNSTQEIVVIDIHSFPVGFQLNSAETHNQLLDYLTSQLSDHLVPVLPQGWTSSLQSIWDTGRHVILSYNNFSFVRKDIWPPVYQKWGNVQTVESLKEYFDRVFRSILNYPWAAMAELTPVFLDVVTDRPGGLRRMAQVVNRNVTRWFQGNYGKSCNIVAVDFLRSTGIVAAAIDRNRRKGLNIDC